MSLKDGHWNLELFIVELFFKLQPQILVGRHTKKSKMPNGFFLWFGYCFTSKEVEQQRSPSHTRSLDLCNDFHRWYRNCTLVVWRWCLVEWGTAIIQRQATLNRDSSHTRSALQAILLPRRSHFVTEAEDATCAFRLFYQSNYDITIIVKLHELHYVFPEVSSNSVLLPSRMHQCIIYLMIHTAAIIYSSFTLYLNNIF